MEFESILKNLIDKSVECHNINDFESMNDILSKRVQLVGDEIKTEKVDMPAVNVTGREEVYKYWREVSAKYANQITAIDFISIGKTSRFLSTYGHLDLKLMIEIHFDKYGKVTKIEHFFK